MGLDFTFKGDHNNVPHYSYGGFMQFRRMLAEEVNINLDEMLGFGGHKRWAGTDKNLRPLLNHSDCEGYLSPQSCKKVAKRMREVIEPWKNSTNLYKNEEYYRAIDLVKTMEYCSEHNVKLIFC